MVDADLEVYRECVAYARAEAAGPVEGLYGPRSVTWTLYREVALLAGSIRALVLQIAHPAIADAGLHSSNFRRDFVGRARRTLATTYDVIFGDLETALRVARRVHGLHRRIVGDGYRANDPELLRWVLATLIDTAVLTYEVLVHPLTPGEKKQLWQETKVTGAVFGVPPSAMPETWADFERYMAEMIAGDRLVIGDGGRELCHAIFNSPLTPTDLDETLTAGLLPPRLREALELPWGPREQRRHAWMIAVLRRVSHLPPFLRYPPAYHQATLRVDRAYGRPQTWIARALNGLDHFLEDRGGDLPLSLKPIPADVGA
jgi:uncharacterized protein (DUF2236 family)